MGVIFQFSTLLVIQANILNKHSNPESFAFWRRTNLSRPRVLASSSYTKVNIALAETGARLLEDRNVRVTTNTKSNSWRNWQTAKVDGKMSRDELQLRYNLHGSSAWNFILEIVAGVVIRKFLLDRYRRRERGYMRRRVVHSILDNWDEDEYSVQCERWIYV